MLVYCTFDIFPASYHTTGRDRSAHRQTFLSADYLAIYPDDAAEIDKLRLAILEYARVIQDALVVHGQGCKDTVFHEALKSRELTVGADDAWLIAHR